MSSNQYPWNNQELVAFWYWEGNYTDTGDSTDVVMHDQGWYLEVSGPRSPWWTNH